MSNTNQKPRNAGKSWSEDHIRIVAAYPPTWDNANMLALRLGRTSHAVQYLWCKLYTNTTWLKQEAKTENKGDGQYTKILKIRRENGICIGS